MDQVKHKNILSEYIIPTLTAATIGATVANSGSKIVNCYAPEFSNQRELMGQLSSKSEALKSAPIKTIKTGANSLLTFPQNCEENKKSNAFLVNGSGALTGLMIKYFLLTMSSGFYKDEERRLSTAIHNELTSLKKNYEPPDSNFVKKFYTVINSIPVTSIDRSKLQKFIEEKPEQYEKDLKDLQRFIAQINEEGDEFPRTLKAINESLGYLAKLNKQNQAEQNQPNEDQNKN
ncbi:MAG: hypothetical protein MK033_06030 [Candidatus Caenarcaniphilales bacterium]|nr:hypothetical protein [Candidatus Caenarcaniphilales bacterium]